MAEQKIVVELKGPLAAPQEYAAPRGVWKDFPYRAWRSEVRRYHKQQYETEYQEALESIRQQWIKAGLVGDIAHEDIIAELLRRRGIRQRDIPLPEKPVMAELAERRGILGTLASTGAMQGAFQQIVQQMLHTAPTAVAAGVGAATGSPLLGSVAGTATGGLVQAAAGAGPIGMAVVGAIGGVVFAAKALKEVFDTLRATASQLASSIAAVSGPVAAAFAQAEVTQFAAIQRRSAVLGTTAAGYIAAQARQEAAWEDLKTSVGELLIPIARDVEESIRGLWLLLKEVVEWLKDTWNTELARTIFKALQLVFPAYGILKNILDVLKWVAEKLGKEKDEEAAIADVRLVFAAIEEGVRGVKGRRQAGGVF